MLDVAVVGAGEVGGAIAHRLAVCDAVSDICLIDEAARIAEGKALDIRQSAAIQSFATRVTGARDLTAVVGAGIIVIADSADGSARESDNNLAILARIAEMAPDRITICAGSAHRDLVEHGVRELGYSRDRLFGSAPEALSAAVRAFVALEAGGSPRDVSLTVVGVPPSHAIVPWESATMAGLPLEHALGEPMRRRLAARVGPLWPPGPYALAVAAVKAITGITGKTRGLVSGFVAPDDGSGRRSRVVALPVRLGSTGIVAVETPPLNSHDRVALDNAMML
jgi:malate/lactate dehydrogenase